MHGIDSRIPQTALVFTLLIGAWATPSAAVHCFEEWEEPVVCEIDVEVEGEVSSQAGAGSSYRPPGADEPRRAVDRSPDPESRPPLRVELAPDDRATLSLTARDQRGHLFPVERMAYELDPGPGCDEIVRIDRLETGVFEVVTGEREGACELAVWVPGNLNLDRRVELEVRETTVPITRAARITERLYLALLGREPEELGLARGEEAIEEGRIESYVRGIVTSDEFAHRRAELSDGQLLDSIYEGLLGRGVDADGRQAYGDEISRGRVAETVLAILRSSEFRRSLQREEARPELRHRIEERRRER